MREMSLKETFCFLRFKKGRNMVGAWTDQCDSFFQSGFDGDSRGDLLDQARQSKNHSIRIVFSGGGGDYKTLVVENKVNS